MLCFLKKLLYFAVILEHEYKSVIYAQTITLLLSHLIAIKIRELKYFEKRLKMVPSILFLSIQVY